MHKQSIARCFVFAAALGVSTVYAASSSGTCPTIDADMLCPAGCWYDKFQDFSDDGSRRCVAARPGYYSPRNENKRIPCDSGTVSNIDHAESCRICPPGTYSPIPAMSDCQVCPPGTYSDEPASTYCTPCNPARFSGVGSNAKQLQDGNVYCMEPHSDTNGGSIAPSAIASPTTDAPTAAPYSAPVVVESTEAPAAAPPSTSSSTQAPTSPTNQTKTTPDPTDSVLATGSCEIGEFEWHSHCQQCPSKVHTVLYPIAIILFVMTVMVVLKYISKGSLATFWIGLEFLQMVYILLLVPLPKTTMLKRTQAILSVFNLDLESAFSLQCVFGASIHTEQLFVICLPVVAGIVLMALSKFFSKINSKWIVVALYLSNAKLVLTSFEALNCKAGSWLCHGSKLPLTVGILGLVLYAFLFPTWLLVSLYKARQPIPPADEDEDVEDLSDREAESNSFLRCWSLDFPFHTSCWWWSGFWMLRKWLLALALILLVESPKLVLTCFLGTLLATEGLQRWVSPIPNDTPGVSRWLRNTTVDMVLQGIMLILVGLGFWLVAANTGGLRVGISILFFAIWVPSILYWIAALLHSQLASRADQEDAIIKLHTSFGAATDDSSSEKSDEEQPNEESDTLLRYSLSLVPLHGSSDHYDEGAGDSVCWEEGSEYGNWRGAETLAIQNALQHNSNLRSASFVSTLSENTRGEADEDFDDDMTEVWYDEKTGRPVDKTSYQNTHPETGVLEDDDHALQERPRVARRLASLYPRRD